ncbi:Heparinase II/III-like protein [compost metagenome]
MGPHQIKNRWKRGRRRGLSPLIPENSVEALRERLLQSRTSMELRQEIEREAERMVKEEDPALPYSLFRIFGDTGERLSYEKVYFERRKRLNTFAMMSMLEPERQDYIEALHNAIWSICDEFTWCLPAHYDASSGRMEIDLFAAETGFTLSEVLLLTEQALPELLKQRIKDEVERRVLRPFLEEGPYGWEKADHNWAAVCAGSIGAAALHLIDDEERLLHILARVTDAMDCYLSGFGDDGVCAEGYLYWQYGFGYYVYFAQLLKAATYGDIDLFAAAKVKEIALFQQKCFTGGNMVVNFSDSLSNSGIFMGLSSCLCEEYEEVVLPHRSLRAPYLSDHCGRWAPALRNLIWPKEAHVPEGQDAALEKKPLWPSEAYYLPDAQWLLSRSVTEDGGNCSFSAKGGHNDEPHNHNDIGHFLIHADGEAYMADLGSGMYTSTYFGADRYTLWCNGSQGHSVPILGGEYQRHGKSYRAVVKEAVTGESEDLLLLDISGAYAAGLLDKLERRLLWSKEGLPSLTLTDTFVRAQARGEEAPLPVTERFITCLPPVLAKEGRIVLRGKRQLSIFYDYLAWEPIIMQRSDMDHFGVERVWFTLDFQSIEGLVDQINGHFVFQFES